MSWTNKFRGRITQLSNLKYAQITKIRQEGRLKRGYQGDTAFGKDIEAGLILQV